MLVVDDRTKEHTVTSLDLLASRAVYAARLFEHAVNSHGPWKIGWGPHEVEAEVIKHEDGVEFRAVFPETCYLEPVDSNCYLLVEMPGEPGFVVVASKAIDFPGDTSFAITWSLVAKVLANDVH